MPVLTQRYSTLFSVIYDEGSSTDTPGRGSHYSIFRLRLMNKPQGDAPSSGSVRDFAVIWDEDHDLRIVTVLERLHRRNLLSNVLFVGERKGSLTVLVDDEFFFSNNRYLLNRYLDMIAAEVVNVDGDNWQPVLGCFSPSGVNERTIHESIINADDHLVQSYLRSIGVKWQLGTKSDVTLGASDLLWAERELNPRPKSGRSAIPSWMILEDE